jgi:hypothetical protein
MNEVGRLLTEKETALRRVKREIDALRLTAALLAEPNDKVFAPAESALNASPFRATPISVLSFSRELEPIGAGAGVAEAKRKHEEPPLSLRIGKPRQPIFPESRDGIIVCDACGHRNPDYLLDCESCDIPIRLRG